MILKARRFRIASASQLKEYLLSARKWYFKKILGLPELRRPYFGFGTTFHEVVQRWLEADANGRGKDGRPVDLFPSRYEVHEFGRPTGRFEPWDWQLQDKAVEGQLIRELVEEAVEKGLLAREPGRLVEFSFDGMELVPGIGLTGFVDYMVPGEARIRDHKTVKSFRYALSERDMMEDPQIVLYSRVLLETLRANDLPLPTEIDVAHINYLKDIGTPKGQRVKLNTRNNRILLSVAHIEERWAKLVATGHEMVKDAAVDPEEYHRVKCGGEECARAYGGCPYAHICAGEETVEAYIKRLDNTRELATLLVGQPPPDIPKEDSTMNTPSLLERLKARQNGSAEATKPAPPPAPPPAPVEEVADNGGSLPPPWAHEGCPACGGSGWNTKKNPCRICISKATAAGKPTDKDVKVYYGQAMWEPRKAEEPKTAPPAPPAEEPKAAPPEPPAEEPMAAPPAPTESAKPSGLAALLKAKQQPETPPPAPTPEPEERADTPPTTPLEREGERIASGEAEPLPEDAPKKRGRPKKAAPAPSGIGERFILVFGGAPTRTTRAVVSLSQILHEVGQQLALAMRADSYYALNAFDRRDALGRRAQVIVDQYIPAGAIVVANTLSPDESSLAAILEPFASTVVHAAK